LKSIVGVLLLLPVALVGCRSDLAGGTQNKNDSGVDQRQDVPRPDVYCAPDAAGGGQCPINFCGQAKVGLPSNQFPQSGADALCGGRTCRVGPELSTGDGFQLECVDPFASALAFGTACSPAPAQAMRCADDSLCVTPPNVAGGAFCSQMCRNDADCPSIASCVEVPTPLTDGRKALIGMCTPRTKIPGTICQNEAGCPAGQGCVLYGARTALRVCKAGGTKSLGAPCAAGSECRSGECYDRDFLVAGGQNGTLCSGPCQVNSDCGADQTCARLVVGNNGTAGDPLDDSVVGYCRSLFPSSNACSDDNSCVLRNNGSDACDSAHGLCYRRAAAPGSPCTSAYDCPLGGDCSTGPRFAGGYCQTFGCDPAATSGVNACPGTNGQCAQRGGPDEPISACYEKCVPGGAVCSRASAGYTCEAPTPNALPSICLVASGT